MAKAKRKEYMVVAEQVMFNIVAAYVREHGHLPGSYSVLKAAQTKAYNNSYSVIYTEISKRLGVPWNIHIDRHPAFNQTLLEVLKDLGI